MWCSIQLIRKCLVLWRYHKVCIIPSFCLFNDLTEIIILLCYLFLHNVVTNVLVIKIMGNLFVFIFVSSWMRMVIVCTYSDIKSWLNCVKQIKSKVVSNVKRKIYKEIDKWCIEHCVCRDYEVKSFMQIINS